MRIAYFDCQAGAGGDMITAAMLDAGLDEHYLQEQLGSLGLEGLRISVEKTSRCGIGALKFTPVAPAQHNHRNLSDITEIIEVSDIEQEAKELAVKIFRRLAEAEAFVHKTSIDEVHFHEVGAIDSIADIVSAAVGYCALGIEKLYCSGLSVGGGTVKTEHGILPVPAPATAWLVENVPVKGGPIEKELLTPTAAAILTTLADGFGPMPEMSIEAAGYGAGSLDPGDFPNIARLFIGTSAKQTVDCDSVVLLESNVDDVSGEAIGYARGLLEKAGALDVYTTAINMKNNRPGVKLSVMAKAEDVKELEEIIFRQGLTFGIRRQVMSRSVLGRRFEKVQTDFGVIGIKVGSLYGEDITFKAEYADCAAAAESNNVSLKTVAEAAIEAYSKIQK